jgi:hypothetical protein
MSAALSRVLSSERGARGAIRVLSTSDWTRRNFARWMFEDEPRALLLTPSRWHRGCCAAGHVPRRAAAHCGTRPG